MTSTSPVGRAGFWLPSGRAETSPATLRQYSERSWWATASSRTTTWTTPLASRRSRKATPPWSRRRATQPARVTVWPTCSARRAPASCVRINGESLLLVWCVGRVACVGRVVGAGHDPGAEVGGRGPPRVGVRLDLVAADRMSFTSWRRVARSPGTTRTGCPGARRTGSACRTSAGSRRPRWGSPARAAAGRRRRSPARDSSSGSATSTALGTARSAVSTPRCDAAGPACRLDAERDARPRGTSCGRRWRGRRSGRPQQIDPRRS